VRTVKDGDLFSGAMVVLIGCSWPHPARCRVSAHNSLAAARALVSCGARALLRLGSARRLARRGNARARWNRGALSLQGAPQRLGDGPNR
jgi:hypothetical protein